MKKACFTIMLFISLRGLSQQVPVSSFAYADLFLLNPASAGTRGQMLNAYYQSYFGGFEGAPYLQSFHYQQPFVKSNVAIGISGYNESANILSTSSLALSGMYHFEFLAGHQLRFGMRVRGIHHRINFSRLVAAADPDQVLLNAVNQSIAWDGAAGFEYSTGKFTGGFAADQIFQNTVSHQFDGQQLAFRLLRHYNLYASYSFSFSPVLTWQQLVIARAVQGLPVQGEVQGVLWYEDRVWAGGGFRGRGRGSLTFGVNIEGRFSIGYTAASSPIDELIGAGLSHEFMVSLRIPERKEQQVDTRSKIVSQATQENQTLNELTLQYEAIRQDIEELRKEHGPPVASAELPYYVVTGTFQSARNARMYQKVLYRETGMRTEIIKEDRRGFYLVYSHTVGTIKEGQKRIKRLLKGKSKGLMMSSPWLYHKGQ